jgi:hypothetical protein
MKFLFPKRVSHHFWPGLIPLAKPCKGAKFGRTSAICSCVFGDILTRHKNLLGILCCSLKKIL